MMKLLFIVVVALMFVSVGIAQPLPYALGGHIYDNESNYIVGAEITLLNERTNDTLILTSSTDGEYQTDAYNFVAHYTNGDTIRYNVTYEDIGAVKTAKIDVSKGGTILDIILTVEDSPETTPNPTPRRQTTTRKATEMYVDADGDGISDNIEKIKGTNPNDACDPNPNCAQCVVKTVTPKVFTPMEDVITTPLPTPKAIAQTPRATPKASPEILDTSKKLPGFSNVICILSLFIVVFLVRKQKWT